MLLLLVGTTSILLGSQSGLGCASLFGEQTLAATDFCFIFDCQNGALGGTVDFCSDSTLESPTFNDCPQFRDDTGG